MSEQFGSGAIPEFEVNLQMMDNKLCRQAISGPFTLRLYRTQHLDDGEKVREGSGYGYVMRFQSAYQVRLSYPPSDGRTAHLTAEMLTGKVQQQEGVPSHQGSFVEHTDPSPLSSLVL